MSEKQDGGEPAYPSSIVYEEESDQHHPPGEWPELSGMTLRQCAALKLRVPDSGLEWLDAMIRKSRRDEFAEQAGEEDIAFHVEAENSKGYADKGNDDDGRPLYELCTRERAKYLYAGAMLAEGERKR